MIQPFTLSVKYINIFPTHPAPWEKYLTGSPAPDGARDALSAAFDNNGELFWHRTYGGGAQEEIMDIIITAGEASSDSFCSVLTLRKNFFR